MKKILTNRAFLLISLFSFVIAVGSFAAFTKTGECLAAANTTARHAHATPRPELLWEVVSRQLVTVVKR